MSLEASASEVRAIDTGRVALESQSASAQTQAGREALAQVFVKMSGSKAVLDNNTIQRAVRNYEQYLVSSAFIQRNGELFFEAQFNPDKILSLLRSTGQSIWASLRPTASVWIAQQDLNNNLTWFHQNNAGEFAKDLSTAAFERGVNFVLPLGDLDDSIAVSAFDVYSQNISKLSDQALRYNTDIIFNASVTAIDESMRERYAQEREFAEQQNALNALINQNTDGQSFPKALPNVPEALDTLQLDWIITGEGEIKIDKVFLENFNELPVVIADLYADYLAGEYATQSTDLDESASSVTRIMVNNVRSLEDFHQVRALVANMPQINELSVYQLQTNQVIFVANLAGARTSFLSLISLDERIRSDEDTGKTDSADITLMWQ